MSYNMETFIFCVVILMAMPTVSTCYCDRVLTKNGLSENYNETVAHAIHSMTVQGLRLFNGMASEQNNHIPTVDHDLSGVKLVREYAPDDPVSEDFKTHSMNLIDKILSNIGKPTDGLGPNWSPIERVAHNFHMWDLWFKIREVYQTTKVPSRSVCECLLDTKNNGVEEAVQWVADHYKSGTPITLLNRPIPKLHDAESWGIWKRRLLHYYTPEALRDAAMYLRCVSNDIDSNIMF